VAIVTGAARERGIGRGIAQCLADEGCDVAVNDVAAEGRQPPHRRIRGSPPLRSGDVSDRTAVDAWGRWRQSRPPASSARTRDRRLAPRDVTEDVRPSRSVNLGGPPVPVDAAMLARSCDCRVTSSVHVQMPFAEMSVYGATKAGLKGMVETMAIELAPRGITVNHIGPGWVRSYINDASPALQTEEDVRTTLTLIPAGRPADPHEMGRAAVYLCSRDGEYVTGEFLRVDGGFVVGKY
jgi:NAD(P)-dependent dehydrogenase (short-subunit alcohol dehydrogenase family)